MPGNFAALEASRVARGGVDVTVGRRPHPDAKPKNGPNYSRTDYGVVRIDCAPPKVIRSNLDRPTAESMLAAIQLNATADQVFEVRALNGNGRLRK